MKTVRDKTNMTGSGQKASEQESALPPAFLKCEDIHELLTTFVMGELAQDQAVVVQAHIRKCDKCRIEADDIRRTIDVFAAAGKTGADVPFVLTPKHSRRVRRAYRHPVLGWIYTHHSLVALAVALIIAAALVSLLVVMTRVVRSEDPPAVIPIEMRLVKEGSGGQIAAPAPPEVETTGMMRRVRFPTLRSSNIPEGPAEVPVASAILLLVATLAAVTAASLAVRRRSLREDDGRSDAGPPPLG